METNEFFWNYVLEAIFSYINSIFFGVDGIIKKKSMLETYAMCWRQKKNTYIGWILFSSFI